MSTNYAHNAALVEEMYEKYLADRASVDASWSSFFQGMEFGGADKKGVGSKEMRIDRLINAYRTYGHLLAKINPVVTHPIALPAELSLPVLGFKEGELKERFPTLGIVREQEATLEKIIAALQAIYAGTIGVEYMHTPLPAMRAFLEEKIEPIRFRPHFSQEKKMKILQDLGAASLFESFLHTKYVGQKRFSLEGGETLIPLLHEIIATGAKSGAQEFVFGMSHRGRLNVLANILQKSYAMIFSEFEDYCDPSSVMGTGDVKYHKGFSSEIETEEGKKVHVALTANASHLESVDPIVLGKVRAKQTYSKDKKREGIIPILIHGDAAIAGQGVVYECMQLYNLAGYTTGGTIHIVVNNNIGFTTIPKNARSTTYCTSLAQAFLAPVFHVNSEDVEGCLFAAQLAMHIRQTFHIDVFIDLNCYRKYGHNEGDEPAFTQPLEYKVIREKKTIREIYRDALIAEGVVDKGAVAALEEQFRRTLHEEHAELQAKKEVYPDEAFGGVWKNYVGQKEIDLFAPVETGVSIERLQKLASLFCSTPSGFALHPKVAKLCEERLKMIREGTSRVDWGMGEQLCFASLLDQKVPVRLSGQDSRRGTFSQRHSIFIDQQNGREYFPLAHYQAEFEVVDSPLSEYAVLGFEFGYSLSYPSALVLFEAQYGDFINGAQIIIDQYLSASEQKWARYSGLTLLLPHGFEGQGPEHSSGRLERFLQLCASDNIQVANPTTPAQYFHLLRRQVLRPLRRPLIVFTPKGLLRHPQATSALQEFTAHAFEEIIGEERNEATRLLLCSGRVYYDLLAEREKRGAAHVALVRIEQLFPLHEKKLKEILSSFPKVQQYFWVQEEPQNMGAGGYIAPLLKVIVPVQLISRPPSAASAAGSHVKHVSEQQELMKKAFE